MILILKVWNNTFIRTLLCLGIVLCMNLSKHWKNILLVVLSSTSENWTKELSLTLIFCPDLKKLLWEWGWITNLSRPFLILCMDSELWVITKVIESTWPLSPLLEFWFQPDCDLGAKWSCKDAEDLWFADMDSVCVYIDDILAATETCEEHLSVLEKVFQQIREAGSRVSVKKANFCKFSIDCVGFCMSRDLKKPIRIMEFNSKLLQTPRLFEVSWLFAIIARNPFPISLQSLNLCRSC